MVLGLQVAIRLPVFVCFDVRHETLSFITTPKEVLVCEAFSILIEYKGKLAVIVPNCLGRGGSSFDRFDLWILEDAEKHDWSRQTFELPFSLPFSLGMGESTTSQGTNEAGEIVFSPTTLPYRAQPFYVFYYNTDTKDMRRVRIHGIADTEEFWSRYGLTGFCCSFFLPHHVDSIASL
ncbi:F-box protein [Raphanus sativus]|nr:F-box protein [Raphanus sativus]